MLLISSSECTAFRHRHRANSKLIVTSKQYDLFSPLKMSLYVCTF